MKASGHRVQHGAAAARRSVAATAWFLFSSSQTKRAGAEAAWFLQPHISTQTRVGGLSFWPLNTMTSPLSCPRLAARLIYPACGAVTQGPRIRATATTVAYSRSQPQQQQLNWVGPRPPGPTTTAVADHRRLAVRFDTYYTTDWVKKQALCPTSVGYFCNTSSWVSVDLKIA